MTGLASYGAVLRVRGAAGFSAAGAAARLPQAMVGLGSVLLLTGLGRSFTIAGLVAGAISLAQGVAAPWVSRIVDRRGQSRVLWPQLAVHVAGLTLLVLAAHANTSVGVLLGLAALVGASLPQFGACARARWISILADDPRIDTALSIESLTDEAVFVVGPVLVTALAVGVAPAAGLIAATALVAVAGALFLFQRATEPAVATAAGAVNGTVSAIRYGGLRVLVLVFFAVGVLFGLIEVGVVALARESGSPGSAGAMLALWAAGSLVSGVFYGARKWRATAPRRFAVATGGMAVGCVLIGASAQSLTAVTVALVVAGLANAPTLITGNILVSSVVPARTVTEAYTWLGVAVFAGIAVGSPLAGALVDNAFTGAALWASALAGGLALAVAVAGGRTLARAPVDDRVRDPGDLIPPGR